MKKVKNSFVSIAFGYAALYRSLYPVYFILFYAALKFNWLLPKAGSRNALLRSDIDFYFSFTPGFYDAVDITPQSGFEAAVLILSSVVIFGLTYYCFWKLHSFLRNVLNGQPFVEENSRVLKLTGSVLMIAVFLLTVKSMIVLPALLPGNLTVNILTGTARILVIAYNPVFITGIIVFVLGQVLQTGSRIQEENNLTV